MSTVAERLKAKRARRPVYLVVRKLVDPDTGELIGALVPANAIDQRLLRERRFTLDLEVRAELKQSRNPAFHRLMHALGGLLVDNVEGFELLTSHEAIKRCQREAGVCCESMELDLGTLGKVPVQVPRSMAFDELDEDEARLLFDGICDHIDRTYSDALTTAARGDYLLMTRR